VPLSTLGPTISATGITTPSYADILTSLQQSFQAIYGSDAYISPDSQDGQLLAIVAKAIADSNDAAIAVYQSFSPTFAQGAGLSSLVKINGIARQVPTHSTAVGNVIGVSGSVITAGVVADANGNLWNLPATVTIPPGGSVAVTVTAADPGYIVAPASTINQIRTPQLGWQAFVNTSAALPGAPVESDADLRLRQAASVGLPAQTPLQSIAAAVANVTGVTRSFVYQNDTAVTDGNGVPSHSIAVVAQGGAVADIATVIEKKKAPGTGTYGTTTYVVTDPGGVPVPIRFFVLADLGIYVSLTIQSLPGYQASTGATIIAAIVAYINSLQIGEPVYYTRLIGIASLVGSNPDLAATFDITTLTMGTAPSPVGVANIAVPFNQAAATVTGNIALTVL
jgi:uncharacterized phage protein gp47/JayE